MKLENEQQQNIAHSDAELAEARAAADRRREVANIEAEQAARLRQQELQLSVEEARREQERASKQAIELTSAQVGKSTAIVEAEGRAEAIRLVAAATRDAAVAEAAGKEAGLLADARGAQAMLEAQAEGTRQLVEACGSEALRDVLWVNHGIPQALAAAKADAVQGMHPKVFSVSGDSAGAVLSKIITGMAPVLDLVENRDTLHKAFKAADETVNGDRVAAKVGDQ